MPRQKKKALKISASAGQSGLKVTSILISHATDRAGCDAHPLFVHKTQTGLEVIPNLYCSLFMHSNQAGLEVMHNLFHTQANWARSATQPVFIHNKLAELEVITILY